jgi:drug/metabolite transporter (DMT)-like permease
MTPVLLALVSAACFGAMTVAIRVGLRDGSGAATATLATILPAFVVALAAAAPAHDLHRALPFFLAGLLAPGCSQILFTLSIREAGASRTSVTVAAAPLVAVAIALVFLDESLELALVIGALAIVGGAVALAGERDRPENLRMAGLAFAVGATVLFAVRDNLARALHAHANPETAAAATLLAGTLAALVYARRVPSSRELRAFAPAGLFFGVSYVCLFEAYFHGPVSVVSPLVATECLWGVGLSALVLGAGEGVGRRLVIGALLVVAGGVLIGVSR